MKGCIFYLVMMALALPAMAGTNVEMNIVPKYQDNLEAFVTLHKKLTIHEREIAVSLGIGKIEMDGIKTYSSAFSSYEQALEKRLNDPLHYVQLGIHLGNIINEVLKGANEYVRFTEFMGSRVKEMPDVALIWANTSRCVAAEINHASKLAEALSVSALLSSRSTAQEKTAAVWALRASVDKIRAIIRRSWTVSSCYIFRDRFIYLDRTLPRPVIPSETIEDLRRRWWNN